MEPHVVPHCMHFCGVHWWLLRRSTKYKKQTVLYCSVRHKQLVFRLAQDEWQGRIKISSLFEIWMNFDFPGILLQASTKTVKETQFIMFRSSADATINEKKIHEC